MLIQRLAAAAAAAHYCSEFMTWNFSYIIIIWNMKKHLLLYFSIIYKDENIEANFKIVNSQ